MRKLIVFNQVSLEGFFSDMKGDMSWVHKQDPAWAPTRKTKSPYTPGRDER